LYVGAFQLIVIELVVAVTLTGLWGYSGLLAALIGGLDAD
jgi:hypothetical protein